MKRRTKSATCTRKKWKEEVKISVSTGEEYSYRQCLFCWSVCPLEEKNEQLVNGDNKYPEMAGSVDSVLLKRNLWHWFIIRKVLDIPVSWSVNKLSTFCAAAAQDDNEKCGGPASWFKVCKDCLNSFVLEAWRVHDQILKLEAKMSDIKAEVRRKIRDNCQQRVTPKQRGEESWNWKKNEPVAMEIREMIIDENKEMLMENVMQFKVEPSCESLILWPDAREEDSIFESKNSKDPLCYETLSDDLTGLHFDDDFDNDDDPNDKNWTPSIGDDDEVYRNHQFQKDQGAVKTENDVERKKNRLPREKKGNTAKVVKRKSYKKKVRDAQTCIRSQQQQMSPKSKLKMSCESDGDSTSSPLIKGEAATVQDSENNCVKKGTGQRGNDKPKPKRKYKPRRRTYVPTRILFPCDLCKCKPFITSEELAVHKKLHEQRNHAKMNGLDTPLEKLNCAKCSFPAQYTLELALHIRNRHDIPEQKSQAQKYPCPLCPKKMRKWTEILYHLKVKHKTVPPEDLERFKDEFLKCDQCGFRATIPRHLIMHKRRHQKQTAVLIPVREEDCRKCEECGRIFDCERNYKLHVANTHKRVNRFVCDICGAGFPFPGKLQSHKISHTKHYQRDWVCHVCGVDFAKKHVLNNHLKVIHPDLMEGNDPTLKTEEIISAAVGGTSEKMYSCRYCDLTSPYNAVIRRHLLTHKQQGEHKCEKCGKCYINAQGLRRHLRINHNESDERFPCPHCNREFSSKEYMMVHVKRYCKIKELPLAH